MIPRQRSIREITISDDDSSSLSDPDSDSEAAPSGGRRMEMEVQGPQTTSTGLELPSATEIATNNGPIPLIQRIAPISTQAPTPTSISSQVESPQMPPGNRGGGKNPRMNVSALLNQNIAGPSSLNFNYNPDSGSNPRQGRGIVQRESPPATSTSNSSGSSKPNKPMEENIMDEDVRGLLGLPPLPSTTITNGIHDADVPNPSTEIGKSDEESKVGNLNDNDGNPTKNENTQSISEYQCPICFSPPTRACMTKCGHVMCGQCLFSAVKAAKQRHVRLYGRGPGPDGEGKISRCPVCRAVMKGWDGKGGGVIGLKLKFSSA